MKNAKELNNSFCGASIYGGEVTLWVHECLDCNKSARQLGTQ
jgi:hypothetical protein